MGLDRKFQYELLSNLRDLYPQEIRVCDIGGYGRKDLMANLFYLYEHELIEGVVTEPDISHHLC